MFDLVSTSRLGGGVEPAEIRVRALYAPRQNTEISAFAPAYDGMLLALALNDDQLAGAYTDTSLITDYGNPKCPFNNFWKASTADQIYGICKTPADAFRKQIDVVLTGVTTASIYVFDIRANGTYPAGTMLYASSSSTGRLAPAQPLVVPEAGEKPIALLLEPISWVQNVAATVTANILIIQNNYGTGAG